MIINIPTRIEWLGKGGIPANVQNALYEIGYYSLKDMPGDCIDRLLNKLVLIERDNMIRTEHNKNSWPDPKEHEISLAFEDARNLQVAIKDHILLFYSLCEQFSKDDYYKEKLNSMLEKIKQMLIKYAELSSVPIKLDTYKNSWKTQEEHNKDIAFLSRQEKKKSLEVDLALYQIMCEANFYPNDRKKLITKILIDSFYGINSIDDDIYFRAGFELFISSTSTSYVATCYEALLKSKDFDGKTLKNFFRIFDSKFLENNSNFIWNVLRERIISDRRYGASYDNNLIKNSLNDKIKNGNIALSEKKEETFEEKAEEDQNIYNNWKYNNGNYNIPTADNVQQIMDALSDSKDISSTPRSR